MGKQAHGSLAKVFLGCLSENCDGTSSTHREIFMISRFGSLEILFRKTGFLRHNSHSAIQGLPVPLKNRLPPHPPDPLPATMLTHLEKNKPKT